MLPAKQTQDTFYWGTRTKEISLGATATNALFYQPIASTRMLEHG